LKELEPANKSLTVDLENKSNEFIALSLRLNDKENEILDSKNYKNDLLDEINNLKNTIFNNMLS
jgi:hypothetical protein